MALYYTRAEGPQGFRAVAFRKALAKAISLAKADGSNHLVILVHTFDSLRHSALEDVIGEGAVKRLLKTKEGVSDGVKITLDNPKMVWASSRTVLLAAYVNNDLRTKAIGKFNASDVIFLPWKESELDDFILKYSAAQEIQ